MDIWSWFTDGVAAVNAWGADLLGETLWLIIWSIIKI